VNLSELGVALNETTCLLFVIFFIPVLGSRIVQLDGISRRVVYYWFFDESRRNSRNFKEELVKVAIDFDKQY
jgi:hypothetical protein